MKTTYKYSMGTDPEMFVRSTKDGKIVPICGLVGGTKDNPLPMRDHLARDIAYQNSAILGGIPEGYRYQEDGVAFEVNIPVCYTSDEWARAMKRVLVYSAPILAHNGLYPDTSMSSHRFDAAQLTHPNANRIGCDPDWSAYASDGTIKATAREPFNIKEFGATRMIGGHVHFGYDKDLIPDHVMAVLVDALVYLPMLEMDQQTDRRRFYGKAGLYRPKDYGMEYRSMSPFWLEKCYSWVGQQGMRLLDDLHVRTEELESLFVKLPHKAIATCINSGITSKKVRALWGRCLREIYDLARGTGLQSAPYAGDWASTGLIFPDHEGEPIPDLNQLLENVG